MSTLPTRDDAVVASPPSRPVLAIVSFSTGIAAVLLDASTLLVPFLAALAAGDGWSQLGFGILGLLVVRVLVAALAIVAAVTGALALRRREGRARAGAGVAFASAALLSVLQYVLTMVGIAAIIPASSSTF